MPSMVSVRPACYSASVPQNQNKTPHRTLLLHFCCQPCFSVAKARSHFSVTAHWVAPGIAPASLLEWMGRPLCSCTGELTTILVLIICSPLGRHCTTILTQALQERVASILFQLLVLSLLNKWSMWRCWRFASWWKGQVFSSNPLPAAERKTEKMASFLFFLSGPFFFSLRDVGLHRFLFLLWKKGLDVNSSLLPQSLVLQVCFPPAKVIWFIVFIQDKKGCKYYKSDSCTHRVGMRPSTTGFVFWDSFLRAYDDLSDLYAFISECWGFSVHLHLGPLQSWYQSQGFLCSALPAPCLGFKKMS